MQHVRHGPGSERENTRRENCKHWQGMCTQWDWEQTARGATETERVVLLLPTSAFLWWRKNHDEFQVANNSQVFFMIIQRTDPQHPNSRGRTALSCPFSGNCCYHCHHLLCSSANQDFPEDFSEECPVFAVPMLQRRAQPLLPAALVWYVQFSLTLVATPSCILQQLYFPVSR